MTGGPHSTSWPVWGGCGVRVEPASCMLRHGKMQSIEVCRNGPQLAVPTLLPCITAHSDLRPQGCARAQLRFNPAGCRSSGTCRTTAGGSGAVLTWTRCRASASSCACTAQRSAPRWRPSAKP